MRPSPPLYIRPGSTPVFPDPLRSDAEGLVAVGGDLSPARLVAAYSRGIFPWYEEGIPPLWWCPDPRAVMSMDALHVSRSLARRLRRGGFELSWNREFGRVIRECGQNRPEGTWIFADMIDAYERLHALGRAHSLEVWMSGELVGGIYGVQCGGLFAAESMFTRRTDAGKVALVCCLRSVSRAGIELFDVQFLTPHLEAMGSWECTREEYLRRLAEVRDRPVDLSAPDLAAYQGICSPE